MRHTTVIISTRSVDELQAKTSELEDEARAWRRQSEALLAAEARSSSSGTKIAS